MTKKGKATKASQRIAEALLRLRERYNLTQRDIAEMLGVSFQQYQKYEKGKDRLSLERAMRLCEVLNIPLGFFAGAAAATGFAESEQEGFGPATPTAEEREILAIYRDIPKKARPDFLEAVRQMAKMIASKR